jgi:hypothetical protein
MYKILFKDIFKSLLRVTQIVIGEYMYIITLKRNEETSNFYKKRIHISLVNLLHNTVSYILYGKQDANTAFRHPLHPYIAWKTLNYLPKKLKIALLKIIIS